MENWNLNRVTKRPKPSGSNRGGPSRERPESGKASKQKYDVKRSKVTNDNVKDFQVIGTYIVLERNWSNEFRSNLKHFACSDLRIPFHSVFLNI